MDNLPEGVTIVSVDYKWWIANRIGQTSSGPGAFWVGNSTSNRRGQNLSAMPWTPKSPGWKTTVSTTANLRDVVYPDGVSRPSWDLNMHFDGGSGANGTYTPGPDGCVDGTTGPSGRFAITYSGVTKLAACPSPQGILPNFWTVNVVLSNGQVLTTTVAQRGDENCHKV